MRWRRARTRRRMGEEEKEEPLGRRKDKGNLKLKARGKAVL